MTARAQQKQQSRTRILDAAAARLRRGGRDGAVIADVMRDADLTHGAFYVHFRDKNELALAAFRHAMAKTRAVWFRGLESLGRVERLRWLAGRYLSRSHRDDPGDGCALATLVGEVGRADPALRQAYEQELMASLERVIETTTDGDDPAQRDDALAFMALCIGGIQLARAVPDAELSENILRACRIAVGRIAIPEDDIIERPVG